MRSLIVITFVILSTGCGKFDKNFKYLDQEQQYAFIELLEAEAVPFEIGAKQYVYYSSDDLEKVEKIKAELSNRFGPEYSVITVKDNELVAAENDFKNLGVDYKVLNTDSGYMIRWARDNNSKVMEILKSTDYYYDPKR